MKNLEKVSPEPPVVGRIYLKADEWEKLKRLAAGKDLRPAQLASRWVREKLK